MRSAFLCGVSAAQSFGTDVAIPVEGAEVVRDTLIIAVSAAGQAEAWRRTVITAQVAGRVTGVTVRENDPVRTGQILVAVDQAEYQLAIADRRFVWGIEKDELTQPRPC